VAISFPKNNKHFGVNFTRMKEELGVTHHQLATICGIAVVTVGRWCRGGEMRESVYQHAKYSYERYYTPVVSAPPTPPTPPAPPAPCMDTRKDIQSIFESDKTIVSLVLVFHDGQRMTLERKG
jgi:hypothetical protein